MSIPLPWLEAAIHQLEVWTTHLVQPMCVGRLNYERATGQAYFEWSRAAQQATLDLSPLKMPTGPGVWNSRTADLPEEYRGLPGFLNDALPDGWGLYMMDKALARADVPPAYITPAARLAYLGDRAWGSLTFRPVLDADLSSAMTLDALGREMEASIDGHLEAVSDTFLQAGSSPQGARPKVMVDCDATFQSARTTTGLPVPGDRSWIIKCAARDEPTDAPLLEQVYMDCARRVGLKVMDSRIVMLHGKPAFATERFDRTAAGRIFCQTLGGLMHFSHRAVGLDYVHVAQVMDALQVPEEAYLEAYRRAVFNAAFSVRDDHAKNFAFVKGQDNRWDVAPAYDLTYMQGPGGYHTMTFAEGRGRDPAAADLLKLAPHYRVSEAAAGLILEEMIEAADEIGGRARDLEVSRKTMAPIEKRLQTISKALHLIHGRAERS